MRRKGVDKDTTRLSVIDAASRQFRRYGYSGVGVDALAKSAGVTSGAIYAHFGSKAGIFGVVLIAGLDQVITSLPMLQAEHGDVWTEKFIDYYLGATHRNDSEQVCAMASLTPEVIHFDADMQEIYEEKMQHIANIIAGGLKASIENNLSKAWVILSLLTGGVNIARSMKNEQSAEQVAASVKEYLRAIGC